MNTSGSLMPRLLRARWFRRHKHAKGVMRIRNCFARFSGVFGAVVRDCCPNRARLGCSRSALFFAPPEVFFDNLIVRESCVNAAAGQSPESAWITRAPKCTGMSGPLANAQNEPKSQKTSATGAASMTCEGEVRTKREEGAARDP